MKNTICTEKESVCTKREAVVEGATLEAWVTGRAVGQRSERVQKSACKAQLTTRERLQLQER